MVIGVGGKLWIAATGIGGKFGDVVVVAGAAMGWAG